MLEFKLQVFTPRMYQQPVDRNCARMATEIGAAAANNLRLSIVQLKAIASGKTLRSVKMEFVLDSPSRGIFRRAVTAARSWQNIQGGRAAGKKMPVRNNGGKWEPLPEMKAWFEVLGIPQAAWFPIMRKIKRDGIKPRNIRDMAMQMSRPRIQAIVERTTRQIKIDIFNSGGSGSGAATP